ncbi:MAG: hypothetical protein JXB29_10005 [Sedimentisphaerales bacterium]|nr:hypothetical protein [Sedimentisphaerales bacterium]
MHRVFWANLFILFFYLSAFAQSHLESENAGVEGSAQTWRDESLLKDPARGLEYQRRFEKPATLARQLFSPSVSQKFYEIAYELIHSSQIGPEQTEQALILLKTASELDSRAKYVLPEMIRLISRSVPIPNLGAKADTANSYHKRALLLLELLMNYVDKDCDLSVVTEAVRYLLEQQDSREQREQMLIELFRYIGQRNDAINSALSMELGLIKAEAAEFEDAKSLFGQAYTANQYNSLAFEKLAELLAQQIKPAYQLKYLRSRLTENPLDIDAALALADYAGSQQLYTIAAVAYEYCVELFEYLYPDEPLPADIYLPWTMSNYNTLRAYHKCIQIASELREKGRYDIVLESIAAKAAAKIGDIQQSARIIDGIEKKTEAMITGWPGNENETGLGAENAGKVTAGQLAWFYCFIKPDIDRALQWANKAYADEPNYAPASAILAYSLVMNGQTDWARPLIESYERTQISELALANIELAEGKADSALSTLRSAIDTDPGSIVAEKARQILAERNAEYIPPTDPAVTIASLTETMGSITTDQIVPKFKRPDKLLSLELSCRGSSFSYGREFDGSVVITNISSEPIVVSDNGLISGNIKIDANITGQIQKKIPNLVQMRFRPSFPVEAGKSIIIPVKLFSGELKGTLLSHPQATLEVEFTVYLDPTVSTEGETINRLSDVPPAKVTVNRPAITLTNKYLQNRLNSLSKGQAGQKMQAAQLFAGLLKEQQIFAENKPPYECKSADWMPGLLKSAIVHSLADDDWVVKIHTMMAIQSLALDYELINALSENLNQSQWPVRLTAMYLLAKAQGDSFKKVLDHIAEYDSNELVSEMAVALGATKPPTTEQSEQTAPADEEDTSQSK